MFHQIPCPQEFSIKYSLISTHRGFPEFLLQIHSESGEVSMEQAVHLSEILKTIFFQNFGARKGPIWTESCFGAFELNLDYFGIYSNRHCVPWPACQLA
jgi:hypothetical protein